MTQAQDAKTVFWHRELPPLDAEAVAEHTVEASSCRVPGSLSHGDDRWRRCHDDLMRTAERRLNQELQRLGGSCAHVHDEVIRSRRDDAAGEAWLQGIFTYTMYKRT